jgi:hypothetical protein
MIQGVYTTFKKKKKASAGVLACRFALVRYYSCGATKAREEILLT